MDVMDVSFSSYPSGRLHATRTSEIIPTAGTLGLGIAYVSWCGVRAIFWEKVTYSPDRVVEEPPTCLRCIRMSE